MEKEKISFPDGNRKPTSKHEAFSLLHEIPLSAKSVFFRIKEMRSSVILAGVLISHPCKLAKPL
jgi:hypothetical protein